MDWSLAGAVTLAGLLVVFAVLVVLVFLCWLLGKIMHREKPSAPAKNDAGSASVQDEKDEGILAAIFAAVACMMEGKPFFLKSIRRTGKTERSDWNAAGIAENTRTFGA